MNESVMRWTRMAALALSLTAFALPALADKSEYMDLMPEQIEERIVTQRKVYRQTMEELKTLENGPMDKASELYRSQHDRLIDQAEKSKVALDSMVEALKIRKQEYRR